MEQVQFALIKDQVNDFQAKKRKGKSCMASRSMRQKLSWINGLALQPGDGVSVESNNPMANIELNLNQLQNLNARAAFVRLGGVLPPEVKDGRNDGKFEDRARGVLKQGMTISLRSENRLLFKGVRRNARLTTG